ncbi:hypothetical protein CPB84DRAFT_312882 [Gymnopilus junonius]|uniref:Uncharacterized protein n=1 Tax=Gymnopilus junonius TaxID=109634 RepID=A0A9P5NET9_GYMJU|nr:hypothetical protein CPB84DRAFT_312882 [Gymnopilus junonius]
MMSFLDTTVPDSSRLTTAIDFGTTFTGVAYGHPHLTNGQVKLVMEWPRFSDTFRKVPTCLLYNEKGELLSWGLEAKHAVLLPGTSRIELFKLFLEPHSFRTYRKENLLFKLSPTFSLAYGDMPRRELMKMLMEAHPSHYDPISQSNFTRSRN